MEELLRRKADIKQRINALSEELTPLLARVENLRGRIDMLETDLDNVREQIRVAAK